jgi:hypothetical protein
VALEATTEWKREERKAQVGARRRHKLGPVYTTVEKSTGHEKKGVSQL